MKFTTEHFIQKANLVHNNLYDYSKSEYINSKIKVCIICRKHGEFWQTPNDHLDGCKCRKCKYETHNTFSKITTPKFIERAINIHKNLYDYTKVIMINTKEKVNIICKIHGIFKQSPEAHMNGKGCPICKSSKGELEIYHFLKERNIKFIKEYKFMDCINPSTNQKMKFDFYLPNYNLCIEYHGRQHYIGQSFGTDKSHSTKEMNLKNYKFRDLVKENYCKSKNIKLLIIPYTMKAKVTQLIIESLSL